MDSLEAFNQALFLQINAGADMPAWLIGAALAIAVDLIYLLPLLLLALWLSGDQARRNLAIKTGLVVSLGIGISLLIGLLWHHPRPFVVGLGHTWLPHAPDSSFPSDHMTVLASAGLTLLLSGARRYGLATLVVALAVAWARIFVGVHYPLDMLGACVVACVAYAVVTPVWRVAGIAVTQWAVEWCRKLLARSIAQGWLRR